MNTDYDYLLDDCRVSIIKQILKCYVDSSNFFTQPKYRKVKSFPVCIGDKIQRHYIIQKVLKNNYNLEIKDIEHYIAMLLFLGCLEELKLAVITSDGYVEMSPSNKQAYGNLTNKGKQLLEKISND